LLIAVPAAPAANRLLGAVPRQDRARLDPALERVMLQAGEVLHEPGRRIAHLYFPENAVVALLCTMENGAAAEAGLVGAEGVVGIDALLGAETASHRAVAQVAGHALRMALDPAREAFRQGGAFQQALLRHTQALMAQVAQTAACNVLHPVEKRLCRWLLLMRDRLPTDEIRMTQDAIAQLLGVRREAVTAAARQLQAMGLMHYARGHILLGDRRAIEAEACECYRAPMVRPVAPANDAAAPAWGRALPDQPVMPAARAWRALPAGGAASRWKAGWPVQGAPAAPAGAAESKPKRAS
jgi:CRP-like cAMP-binding protein